MQVLRTCKEIYKEVGTELSRKTTMLIKIKANYPFPGIERSLGSQSIKLVGLDDQRSVEQLWSRFENIVTPVPKVHQVEIDVNLVAPRGREDPWERPRTAQYLCTLTAACRTSGLQTLTLRLDSAGRRSELDHLLWPLQRIKSRVIFAMEGVRDVIRDGILSWRQIENIKPDIFLKSHELMDE